MPNPLDMAPVAPDPQGGNPLQQGAPAQPGTPIPQQQEMPAPTRQQTIVALRHFSAIEEQLEPLLRDPDLGKSDLKSKIIDGVTRLVSTRMLTPAQAVLELGNVPDKPLDQRKWAQQQMQQTQQAKAAILEHYRQSPHQDEGTELPHADDHMQDLQGLMSHYKGLKRG